LCLVENRRDRTIFLFGLSTPKVGSTTYRWGPHTNLFSTFLFPSLPFPRTHLGASPTPFLLTTDASRWQGRLGRALACVAVGQGSAMRSPGRRRGRAHPHGGGGEVTHGLSSSSSLATPIASFFLNSGKSLSSSFSLVSHACGTRPTEDDSIRSFFGGRSEPASRGNILTRDVPAPRGLQTKQVGVWAIPSLPCWSFRTKQHLSMCLVPNQRGMGWLQPCFWG
jgi:hypothetical protein